MAMDLKLIQKLVALMERGKLAELEIEDKESGLKVRLKGESAAAPAGAAPMVHVLHGGGAPAAAPVAAPAAAGEAPKPAKQGTTINSPMVGTFYKASSPDAEPFVRPGVRVAPEKTLCIIEAMKVMNEIKCEISGEILEVLVENGAPVEFGQPLFLVKTD